MTIKQNTQNILGTTYGSLETEYIANDVKAANNLNEPLFSLNPEILKATIAEINVLLKQNEFPLTKIAKEVGKSSFYVEGFYSDNRALTVQVDGRAIPRRYLNKVRKQFNSQLKTASYGVFFGEGLLHPEIVAEIAKQAALDIAITIEEDIKYAVSVETGSKLAINFDSTSINGLNKLLKELVGDDVTLQYDTGLQMHVMLTQADYDYYFPIVEKALVDQYGYRIDTGIDSFSIGTRIHVRAYDTVQSFVVSNRALSKNTNILNTKITVDPNTGDDVMFTSILLGGWVTDPSQVYALNTQLVPGP